MNTQIEASLHALSEVAHRWRDSGAHPGAHPGAHLVMAVATVRRLADMFGTTVVPAMTSFVGGIPIVLDDEVPEGAWRLVDRDGTELQRCGYLPGDPHMRLLLQLNKTVLERDDLRDRLKRLDPLAAVDAAAMRDRLTEAADGLSRITGAGLGSALDITRIEHAIQVMTDAVRVLYERSNG